MNVSTGRMKKHLKRIHRYGRLMGYNAELRQAAWFAGWHYERGYRAGWRAGFDRAIELKGEK